MANPLVAHLHNEEEVLVQERKPKSYEENPKHTARRKAHKLNPCAIGKNLQNFF